jgi:hypothetical protein
LAKVTEAARSSGKTTGALALFALFWEYPTEKQKIIQKNIQTLFLLIERILAQFY